MDYGRWVPQEAYFWIWLGLQNGKDVKQLNGFIGSFCSGVVGGF